MAPQASEEVEIVPAAPDPEPQQQQEEGDVTAAHQDSDAAAKIKELLSKLQLRRERFSQLLGPPGHRGGGTSRDTGRRCLAFMDGELDVAAAFLTTLSPQHQEDYAKRLEEALEFIADRVLRLRVFEPSRHTLLRGAAQCFHRSKPYYEDVDYVTALLYQTIERLNYKSGQLTLTSSDVVGLTSLQVAEAGLVGMDRPVNKLLWWLTHQDQGNKSLRVMSIVGPLGIGKTTLAMELRNRLIRQQETSSGGRRYHFTCNVMAQASRGTDRNILLLQDILSQVSEPAATALSSDASQADTLEDLVRLVRQHLQDKRYFIVIDDICQASDWNEIKRAFPYNNLHSRILITTRVTSTAWACSSDSYGGLVHEMKALGQMDSERLLLTKALGSVDGCLPNNMKQLCGEILWRCDGIPLFITGVADWLKEQLQKQQQREHEDEKEQVPPLPERFQQALCSAFNDFPNDRLRKLSLYMSMFPYGYKFDKDRLISILIQEGLGFMSDRDEVEAETLFSQLVDRNVVTCVATDCRNNRHEAEACQWHINHFMHQFLASKSAEIGFVFTAPTLNLLAAASPAKGHGNEEPSSRIPRKLALHHPDPLPPSLLKKIDLSQTRSLAVSGSVSGIPLDRFINLVVLDFEGWRNLTDEDLLQVCRSKMLFLRYLSVRNTQISKLPHEIKELQMLRKLDVSYTQIPELPLEVFFLINLRYLDLRGTRISQLPKHFVGLWHLLIGGQGTVNSGETSARLPQDVQHLRNLHTLATVDLTGHPARFVRDIGDLHRLKVVAVTWSFHQSTDKDCCEALLSSIEKWYHLKSLTIHCGLGCSMDFLGSLSDPPRGLKKFKVTAGRFASVPPWIGGLKYLAFVQITVCKQGMHDLKILGGLPNLQCLILGLDFIPGQAIVIGNRGFRKLQRFSVDCPMPWLTFQTGATPSLTHLEMKFSSCPPSEERVPSGITDLLGITEVVLSYNTWYANSASVKMTVNAVREQVAKHCNPIDLFINGIEDDAVQEIGEEPENATGTSSGTDVGRRDDAQAVDEEATGVVEIEITEAED